MEFSRGGPQFIVTLIAIKRQFQPQCLLSSESFDPAFAPQYQLAYDRTKMENTPPKSHLVFEVYQLDFLN